MDFPPSSSDSESEGQEEEEEDGDSAPLLAAKMHHEQRSIRRREKERAGLWMMLGRIWLHNHQERKLAEKMLIIPGLFKHSSPAGHSLSRVDGSSPSQLAAFAADFIAARRPAMITGLAESWAALRKWATADALLAAHGDVALHFTELDGESVRIPLAEYVRYTQDNTADNPFYLFEADMASLPELAPMAADFETPPIFADDLFQLHRPMLCQHQFVIIGGNRTGSNLHVDPSQTAAWNTLLCGRKKWVLFPPNNDTQFLQSIGVTTARKTTPPLYWWMDVYPSLTPDMGAIEVIQAPGETIFVPQGWWHCVINLELCVAASGNVMLPPMLPLALQELRKDMPEKAEAWWRELKEHRPDIARHHANAVDEESPSL